MKHTNIYHRDDTDQLRQISIADYLENQGFRPVRHSKGGRELLYFSPLRNESSPSFSVNTEKNLWYDYGEGKGGDIFSLVMKLWSVDFHVAKEILRKEEYKEMFYRPTDKQYEREKPSPFTDISVSPLTSSYFLDYCAKRSIDLEVAKAECRQVDYRLYGHMNSAIGFANDEGGWELRSPTTKICTCKAISTRKKAGDGGTVCVFEGFFDYLSFLTMMKPELRGKFDYVVLNTVAQASKVEGILKGYRRVLCYLDNDAAGQNSFEKLREFVNAENRSERMLPYNDVNEYLCGQKAPTPCGNEDAIVAAFRETFSHDTRNVNGKLETAETDIINRTVSVHNPTNL